MVVGRRLFVLGVALGSAFAACGGTSEKSSGDGSGGTGGTAPNTCPPTLVNYGSGPGILCNDVPSGTTCSDTEQFCVCGSDSIEGRPWDCVPTRAGCPPGYPDGYPCDASAPEACEFLTAVRMTCSCSAGTWACEQSRCNEAYPGDGSPCTLGAGETCRFFLPATASDPENAPNVTCTCTADQTWSCPAW